MRKIFKFALIFVVAGIMSMGFNACSKEENDNEDKYSDRTYGQYAIDACNDIVIQLEAANRIIASTNLNPQQETYLRNTLEGLVNNVIVPTYTKLADDVEDLEKTLNGLTVSTITQ